MPKQFSHDLFVAIGRPLAKLLPDKVPLTFVGAEAVRELCASIGHGGITKVLIVTDRVLVDIGIAGKVAGALTEAGVEHSLYAGVEPDPTFSQVDAGFAQYRQDGCEGVLAVGGGSPMDAAKMIAALATNSRPLAKLEGRFKVRQAPAPLFAVPTTAGTGSEVTIAAVISDDATHAKKFFLDPKLLPQMVALDPTLMTGVPPAITAATGMDALTHAVESFVSKASNPQTETYAKNAVRLIFANLPAAYANGQDLAARKAMALASYYAGLAFTRTSVGYVHAIAHNFGAHYKTPHGLANAIALPHVLDFSLDAARTPLAHLADLIGLAGNDDASKARAFIAAVRDLMNEIDIPDKLAALQADDIPTIAESALAEAHMNYPVPRYMRYMSQQECQSVLARMSHQVS